MRNTYARFSNVKFLSTNYPLKFLFIAFLGVHIPLLAIIACITFKWIVLSSFYIIIVTLVATLVAAMGTLYLLNGLLWPIHATKNALEAYVNFSTLPELPTNFKDEAGILLKQTQFAITTLDSVMKDREDLIAICSHDLKMPASICITYADMMMKTGNKDEINEFAEVIKQTSRKQLQLISDIVHLLAMKDFGNEKANNWKQVPLKTIVDIACKNHEKAAQAKGVNLNIDVVPNIYIYGEMALLVESLANLISNAIKFSYPGGSIWVKCLLVNGTTCQILVVDEGIGMDKGTINNLFQRFSKNGKNGTAGETSTGLGLYLAKNFIAKYNGNLTAESAGENKGSVFTVQLPFTDSLAN